MGHRGGGCRCSITKPRPQPPRKKKTTKHKTRAVGRMKAKHNSEKRNSKSLVSFPNFVTESRCPVWQVWCCGVNRTNGDKGFCLTVTCCFLSFLYRRCTFVSYVVLFLRRIEKEILLSRSQERDRRKNVLIQLGCIKCTMEALYDKSGGRLNLYPRKRDLIFRSLPRACVTLDCRSHTYSCVPVS